MLPTQPALGLELHRIRQCHDLQEHDKFLSGSCISNSSPIETSPFRFSTRSFRLHHSSTPTMPSSSLIPQPPPISDDSSHRMIEGRHDKSLDGERRTQHIISFSNFESIQYTQHLPHGVETPGRFGGASRLHSSSGHQAANPPRSDESISDTGHVAPKPDGTRICLTSHTAPNSGIPGQPSLEAGGAKEAKCSCENLELGIMPPAQLIHNGNLYRVKQDPVEFYQL
ncbi:hypothetical protein CNYM01_13881 [Colletotrichum nymphaeae SA-01]|uniref:Uncharacterized protein n=1 Tax=Colletotrichum nymphaeae SA-01 TaxID=1460502 RepID=A0A135U1X3_9PEZI|nr:hypothetical protein CNYM01_13881 [Colletotrichum nymphaeae SA-01]